MASKRTWVGAGQGCLWEPRKMPPLAAGPRAVPPGQASLCPTVPAPALCALFFLKGPSPSPPPSLSSAPHTGPWGGYIHLWWTRPPQAPQQPWSPSTGVIGSLSCGWQVHPPPAPHAHWQLDKLATCPPTPGTLHKLFHPEHSSSPLPPRAPVHQISTSHGSVGRLLVKSIRGGFPNPSHSDFPCP